MNALSDPVPPTLDFKSPEELEAALRRLASRLHYVNRVSGESHFTWSLAEMIRATGDLARLLNDDATTAEFGTGYSEPGLTRAERKARILQMLADRLPE